MSEIDWDSNQYQPLISLGRPLPKPSFFKTDTKTILRGVAFWMIGIAVFLTLILTVVITYRTFPAVAHESSIDFSETRARSHLDILVNGIGPRPVGTLENRNQTKNYILGQLELLKNKTNRLSWTVRKNFGYSTTFSAGSGFYWNNLDNIVAEIPGNGLNRSKLLVSAHYDTVTMSPGAFDDTSGIVVLLELAQIFSNGPVYENDLVLLFNNGEESGLLGSVDFACFDPMWDDISGFINLDSTPGSKSMLFRSSGSWLDYQWMSVPRPLGSVVASDFFKLRLIRSETDFSIYNDPSLAFRGKNDTKSRTHFSASENDGRPGLDFAAFDNRQIYHTLKDTTLQTGTLQFMGDNIVALVKKTLLSKNLRDHLREKKPIVYFSVLEGFAVVYSVELHYILHCVLSVSLALAFAIIFFLHQRWWKSSETKSLAFSPIIGTLIHLGKLVLAIIVGIFFSVLIGILLSCYRPLFYFNSVTLGLITFVFPTLCGICLVLFLFAFKDHYDNNRGSVEQAFEGNLSTTFQFTYPFLASSLLWTILIIVLTPFSKELGSTYVFLYPGVFLIIILMAHCIFEIFHRINIGFHRASGASFEFLPADGDQVTTRTSKTMSPKMDHKNSDLVRTTEYTIFYSVLFVVYSFSALLLLYDIVYKLLLAMLSIMPASIISAFVAITTSLSFISFYPLTRRANIFGVCTIVCFVATIVCLLTASFAPMFDLQQPWSGNPSHVVFSSESPSLSSSVSPSVSSQSPSVSSTLSLLLSPTAQTPSRIYKSRKRISEIVDSSQNISEIQLAAGSFFGDLKQFISEYFGVNNATCTIAPRSLFAGSYDFCYWAVPPPHVPPMNYTVTHTNTTINNVEIPLEVEDPEILYQVSVSVLSPGALIHQIAIVTTDDAVNSVLVNDHLIQTGMSNLSFTYFFPDDNEWTLSILFSKKNFAPSENVTVSIFSMYDKLSYSRSITDLIHKLPDWATFTGTGEGLITVAKSFEIPLQNMTGI